MTLTDRVRGPGGLASGAQPLSRRAFMAGGSVLLGSRLFGAPSPADLLDGYGVSRGPVIRLGLMTDLHHADKPPAGTRHYRDTLAKVRESVAAFNSVRAELAVELGDFIDAAEDIDSELGFLATVEAEYEKFGGDRHYVIGNHCVWRLTKEQFLSNSGARQEHYSFDAGGFHFVVLDACYREDGVPYGNRNFEWTDTDIPPAERGWLRDDLAATDRPTIVFCHQRLDVSGPHGVKSGPLVRDILERSEKVLAVFQGHSHQNEYRELNGIHYCVLAATVEGAGLRNNAYAILELHANGLMKLDGYRTQASHRLRPRALV